MCDRDPRFFLESQQPTSTNIFPITAIMNSRISRSYGKKRSRLKTGGVIQHAVNAGSLGSTDQLQRGGMDLLLMVLESGLVEAEEQQSHPSEISCQTQSIKSDLNQRISHYRAGEVPASRKFSEESFSEGTRFPCNSDAAQEIWVSELDIQSHGQLSVRHVRSQLFVLSNCVASTLLL